jgi:hypothetical protein
MCYHTTQSKLQEQLRIRQKKLGRAVPLAVLLMSVAPTIAQADVQLDEGSGATASALTTITNTVTIAPAGDFLNVETNAQLTGAITNSGNITAGDHAFEVQRGAIISGTITAGGSAFKGTQRLPSHWRHHQQRHHHGGG